jgi:uncharacterized protein
MHLQDIYTYPIKSLGGIRMEQANLEERGLQHDRRWMLVDKEGQFLSQRKHPKMALLQTDIIGNGISVVHKDDPNRQILVPFESQSARCRQVRIWEDRVEAQLVDSGISGWFSDFLGIACDLVYMPQSTKRRLKPKYAVNDESVSFADGMPYLLIGQASLDDLNSRLDKPVPMNRFRPNIVFAGGSPFQEDEWNTVTIGDALFKITKPCARCVVTTVDQQTGQKGMEPLTMLTNYRNVDGIVMFGQNMLLLEGIEIQVGDTLSFQNK